MRIFANVVVSFAVCAVLAGNALAQDATDRPTVKPTNLYVTRGRSDPKLFGPGQTFSDSIILNLNVSAPGHELLRLDADSRLTTFEDDKGNSLLDPKAFPPPAFNAKIFSLDRANMIVVVANYRRAPAVGASRVHVKGDLILVDGRDVRSAEAQVNLNAQSEQTVGPLTLKLDPKKQTPAGFYFDLIGEARAMKAISGVGADGKEVKVVAAYQLPSNAGPRLFTFFVPKTNAEFKLKLNYYGKEAKIKVPVDMTIGAGL